MTRNSCTAFCGNGLPRLESCPTDAALQHVVLEAHAVDEDVGLLGGLRVAGDRLALRIGRQPDAGRERREVEEVAVVLRQVLDLLRA